MIHTLNPQVILHIWKRDSRSPSKTKEHLYRAKNPANPRRDGFVIFFEWIEFSSTTSEQDCDIFVDAQESSQCSDNYKRYQEGSCRWDCMARYGLEHRHKGSNDRETVCRE
mmetsp:Transcript_13375/g.22804  ORF Transcript_13375/g.22804 Transcript_13375/m.22804 type:complete len:111 (+) Transcript_13375:340-672(+)